jgi:hypothetical protein
MDKVKVKVTRLDGTTLEAEGTPDEVAKVLRQLDREQMAPIPMPYVIVVPAPDPTPCYPYISAPIWAPAPTIAPTVPGWPIITCGTVQSDNTNVAEHNIFTC